MLFITLHLYTIVNFNIFRKYFLWSGCEFLVQFIIWCCYALCSLIAWIWMLRFTTFHNMLSLLWHDVLKLPHEKSKRRIINLRNHIQLQLWWILMIWFWTFILHWHLLLFKLLVKKFRFTQISLKLKFIIV